MANEELESPAEEQETETSTETEDAEQPAPEGEEAPTTEKSDAEDEPAAEDDVSKKLSAAEKKLAKMSYEQREARRREERLIALLEERKQQTSETQPPKIEDFETLDDYIDARYAYNAQKSAGPKQETGIDPGFHQAREDLMFEGSGKYEDFVEKVTSDAAPITPVMANAIFELEDMDSQVEIAYTLANNPREAMRISRLSPLRQVAEIGKLEAKLSAPTPAKKQPSKAPQPIKPVGGSKTNSDEIADEEDFETFLKKRNKQLGRG